MKKETPLQQFIISAFSALVLLGIAALICIAIWKCAMDVRNHHLSCRFPNMFHVAYPSNPEDKAAIRNAEAKVRERLKEGKESIRRCQARFAEAKGRDEIAQAKEFLDASTMYYEDAVALAKACGFSKIVDEFSKN